jgi:hypothetical protein
MHPLNINLGLERWSQYLEQAYPQRRGAQNGQQQHLCWINTSCFSRKTVLLNSDDYKKKINHSSCPSSANCVELSFEEIIEQSHEVIWDYSQEAMSFANSICRDITNLGLDSLPSLDHPTTNEDYGERLEQLKQKIIKIIALQAHKKRIITILKDVNVYLSSVPVGFFAWFTTDTDKHRRNALKIHRLENDHQSYTSNVIGSLILRKFYETLKNEQGPYRLTASQMSDLTKFRNDLHLKADWIENNCKGSDLQEIDAIWDNMGLLFDLIQTTRQIVASTSWAVDPHIKLLMEGHRDEGSPLRGLPLEIIHHIASFDPQGTKLHDAYFEQYDRGEHQTVSLELTLLRLRAYDDLFPS